MTKRLLLLRHAQSDLKYTGIDKQRPLTPKGISEAVTLGYYIRDNSLSPDYVFCSDAWRTRETLEQIRECQYRRLNPDRMTLLPILYIGEVDDYMSQLRSADDDVDTLMLIGHYPRIPVLARMLVNAASEQSVSRLLDKYEPATMTILSCKINKWKDLRYGANTLIDVVNPNDYVCHLF